MARLADTVRFILLPNLGLIIVPLVLVAFGWLLWLSTTGPTATQTGEVIRFGTFPLPRATGDGLILTVRLSDGTITQLQSHRRSIPDCRQGDRIRFTKGSGWSRVDSCTRPAS